MVTAAELFRVRLREWRESGSEIQTTSNRSLHAKYMWLTWARPPADTVAKAHRGEAFISLRATRSRLADENRRERRSIVTHLVWPPRQAEGDGGGDGNDLPVIAFDQLPSALVHHAVMPTTEQDQVVELGRTAVDPVHQVMPVAL